MGEEDIRRQKLNVFNMKMMGAEVRPVTSGSRTLRDAINEAMRDWMATVENTHYIIGSVVGPHPFPMMVRDFQAVIGKEARQQCLDAEGRLPDEVIACVGGGSNSAGMFYPFVDDADVNLTGVEAGGHGPTPGEHASTLSYGAKGVLHGSYSYVLQDEDGQTSDVHSVSAGLDYPGVGPGAQLLEGHRPGELRQRHRQRSAGHPAESRQTGRHHSRPGKLPCTVSGNESSPGPLRR